MNWLGNQIMQHLEVCSIFVSQLENEPFLQKLLHARGNGYSLARRCEQGSG